MTSVILARALCARPTIASRTSTRPILGPFGVRFQREPTPLAHLDLTPAPHMIPHPGAA
jgi:hypothetical protein